MKNIKAVIFDMDGILLDSETICDKTWQMALKDFNLIDNNDTINKCRGTNKTDTILILKQYFGQDFNAENFLTKTSEYFHKIEFEQGISLMPYAKEILKYLKEKNYRIALASSTRYESVKRQLTNAGIIDYFETITTGDMVTHSKPNPEIYQKAIKSLNLKPEECIAIEDSPNGIKSAFAANLKVIMIPDKIQPTEEIKQIIEKIYPNLNYLKEIL
jgi:HAD superfamily hydrolase (TIGR01509 family)